MAYISYMDTMNTKKMILIAGGLVLALLVVGLFYKYPKKAQPEKGAVDTAGEVSKSVPEIFTNPAEKVPEVNPLDRANPFKYNNPLK